MSAVKILQRKPGLFIASMVFSFFVWSGSISAQTAAAPPKSQFIGLFVHNLDSTIAWYKDKLGFTVLKQQEISAGLKFAVIEWNGFWIEMIQHPKAITRKSLDQIELNRPGTEGFFKLGFYVEDIKYWDKYFREKAVKFKYQLMRNDAFKMDLFILEDPEGNLIQFYHTD
jgi:catechol 2,3-dioxygenase-like lactoylglutathione lyase family enzyme